jgi:very-short-patch-repair endonuclease
MKQLFSLHERSKYWGKNNSDELQNISLHSSKKYWFDCNICNHSFLSAPKTIVKGHWCPYCANQAVCGNSECKECFDKSFASHEKSKYWSSKNNITPINILKGSSKKYWFKCNKCPHEFESQISGITGERNRWCKFCSNQALCNNETCEYCFEKSFASCKESVYWSSKNIKKPREVFKKSDSIKHWFKCPNCPHDFEKTCSDIIIKKSFCPYCAITNGILCGNEKCNYCFEKSFASHKKAQYWSSKNDISPINVKKGSEIKYWFKCYKCPHEFNVVLNSISRGQWCPYCAEPCKKLCGIKNCSFCFEKSFASHEKAKYWSSKNELSIHEVCKVSGKKFWFSCRDCNQEFKTTISSITKNNTWCPYCINKTEKKLNDFLKSNYSVIYQYKAEWCINVQTGLKLPFDFCIFDFKTIIELDGAQHFIQIMNWKSPEEQRKMDYYKQKQANINGFSVIRIIQEDVLFDRFDWSNKLLEAIRLIQESQQTINIYLSSDNKYHSFIQNM